MNSVKTAASKTIPIKNQGSENHFNNFDGICRLESSIMSF